MVQISLSPPSSPYLWRYITRNVQIRQGHPDDGDELEIGQALEQAAWQTHPLTDCATVPFASVFAIIRREFSPRSA